MSGSKKGKSGGIKVVFWLIVVCVIVTLFLVKKDDMLTVLKNTDFFAQVFGREPAFVSNHVVPEPVSENSDEAEQSSVSSAQIVATPSGNTMLEISVSTEKPSAQTAAALQPESSHPSGTSEPEKAGGTPVAAGDATVPVSAPEAASAAGQSAQQALSEKAATAPAAQTTDQNTAVMDLHIWFVQVDGDGTVVRKEVLRALPKSGTPLADSLRNLLAGPSIDEIGKGYISLIPEGTELLSASVSNKTATLNFSDAFLFNKYGVEGYLGQLMQIVYTATAFPTIDAVQFLVEGQRQEFLGSEGVLAGYPLSRASFN